MKPNPKRVLDRLSSVLHAWATIRSEETFAGMSLAQFREAVQPSLAARERLALHQSQAEAAAAQRDEADEATMELVRRLIAGVLAHEKEGANGEMYKVLGYVLANRRNSGLTRRSREVEPDTGQPLKAAA